MEKDQIFILKDRGVIYISGEEAKDFLQNIITNDINKVSDTRSCFSSLLSPQGKYLFDFMVVKHKQGYFLDCELNQINDLVNRLSMYKLNSQIEILNLSNEFQVAVISNEKFLSLNNSKDDEGITINFRDDPIFIDPRNKKLGARLIINLEKLYLSIKKLELQLEDSRKYYELSHKLGIAQINTKNLQEKIFGLECNFEKLNGIDFKKGCYVGQENTARMKLKNKLRKKLVPIKSDKTLKVGTDLNFNNKKIGQVLIGEPYPFALIKLFDPDFSEFKDKEISIDNVKVKLIDIS
jgi:folate-binding protein YgfZ|tara:strand:+ start:878 stop:1759 length:882 start_codon:yes stop_codon:yes gene_type:complete